MEACGGAHFWARKLSELGHTVRLMAPQFVKPYVKTNKSDARDAEAICEAVARPNMRFDLGPVSWTPYSTHTRSPRNRAKISCEEEAP
jgi:transposase